MAQRLQQAGPVVGSATGLDADHRRRQLREEGHQVMPPQLLAQDRLLGGVHPVQLEDVF
jgi:hypothetical protein